MEEEGQSLHADIKIAPNIGERAKLSHETRREAREHGESFPEGSGEYTHAFFREPKGTFTSVERNNMQELLGTEMVLTEQIDAVLAAKSERGDLKPAVFLDFGGMFGITTLKLAEKYKQEVQASKIVFVVTNLADIKGELIEQAAGRARISEEAVKVFNANQAMEQKDQLVHYIQADAAELRKQSVLLPSGTVFSLKGSIDVAHESSVFVHGWKNDVDIPLLARELSIYGTLFLSADHSAAELMEEGIKNLKSVGVRKTVLDTIATYDVYQRDGAAIARSLTNHIGRQKLNIIDRLRKHI